MTEFFKVSTPNLRSNLHFFVWECERRGILAEVVHPTYEAVKLTFKEHTEYILDIYSSLMSVPCSALVGNKAIVKKLLEASSLPFIPGEEFWPKQESYIHKFADYLEFPVVLKPSIGSNGTNVFLNINSHEEIDTILPVLLKSEGSPSFLIEKHINGEDLKVFITRQGKYAAITRELPYVIGDGISSIKELIDAENAQRLNELGIRRLAPIPVDSETTHHLDLTGNKLSDIPSKDTTIIVRGNANVGTGALSVDCTDQLSDGFVDMCKKVLKIYPNLPYAAIDFIVPSVKEASSDNSYICEINTLPSLGIHMAPAKGKGQNVAAMIIDMLFPETTAPTDYSFDIVG